MLVEKKLFFGMKSILALLANTLIFLAMCSRRISVLGSATVLVVVVVSILD